MSMAECTPENVYNLSHFCVDFELASPDIECFNRKVSPAFTDFITVWCILNAICGTFGNFLTLVAVPWAAYKKRPGFRGAIQPTTVFILMLAGSDFIYCVVNLPLYAVQYLNRRWTMVCCTFPQKPKTNHNFDEK